MFLKLNIQNKEVLSGRIFKKIFLFLTFLLLTFLFLTSILSSYPHKQMITLDVVDCGLEKDNFLNIIDKVLKVRK